MMYGRAKGHLCVTNRGLFFAAEVGMVKTSPENGIGPDQTIFKNHGPDRTGGNHNGPV